jgi:hypothetical protein
VQASIPYTAAVRTHASIDSYDARARTYRIYSGSA